MSYRCEVCGTKVAPRQPRRVFRVLRDKQIVREVQVCDECDFRLRHGATPAQLMAEARAVRPEEAPPAPAQVPSLTKHAVTFGGQAHSWKPGTGAQCMDVTGQ